MIISMTAQQSLNATGFYSGFIVKSQDWSTGQGATLHCKLIRRLTQKEDGTYTVDKDYPFKNRMVRCLSNVYVLRNLAKNFSLLEPVRVKKPGRKKKAVDVANVLSSFNTEKFVGLPAIFSLYHARDRYRDDEPMELVSIRGPILPDDFETLINGSSPEEHEEHDSVQLGATDAPVMGNEPTDNLDR